MRSYHHNNKSIYIIPLPVLFGLTLQVVIVPAIIYSQSVSFYVKGSKSQMLNEVVLSRQVTGGSAIKADFPGKTRLNSSINESVDNINDIKLGDVDNDGFEDLSILSNTKLHVIKGTQKGFNTSRANAHITTLYDPEVKLADDVTLQKIQMGSPIRYVLDKNKLAGRMAIGDINNDGKNEVVIARRYFYSDDPHGPYGMCYTAVDVMVWSDSTFKVIDRIIRYADAREGVFIIDVDQDSVIELAIGDDSFLYFYKWATPTEKSRQKLDKHWMAGSLGFNLVGDSFIHFYGTSGAQRYGLSVVDWDVLLARCLVWGRNPEGRLGDILVYKLNPQDFKSRGKLMITNKMYTIQEFEPVLRSFSIPQNATSEKAGKINLLDMKGLELGKSPDTGNVQVAAHLKDHSLLFVIE